MKKALAFVLLITIAFSLVACNSTSYDEIINTSTRGKATPNLNIKYNSNDNSLRWNAVGETNTYEIQINEYAKTIEGNAIWFKEALDNGIYTVSITPEGYKTVTTLITIGIKNQKSDIKQTFIITLLIINILSIGAVTALYLIKKKNIKEKPIEETSTDYIAKEDSQITPSEIASIENQYNQKLQTLETQLKEAEDKLEKMTQNYIVSKEEKEKIKKDLQNNNNEKITNLQTQLEYTKSELSKSEEKLSKTQDDLSKAIIQIAELKSAPPKIQEKIVYKTVESTKDFGKFKKKYKDYRKQNDATICCADGHYVRSKAEKIIDDFFYVNRIPHAYEKIFTDPKTGQQYYADFYLPDAKLYIEYFGLNTEEYKQKRERKIEAYNNNPNINFEFLDSKDDDTMNDKLQKICTKYKIPFTF